MSLISLASKSRSKSSRDPARSASTVNPAGPISAKPPTTTIGSRWPSRMIVTMPGRSKVTIGACPGSTPRSPSMPGRSTWSTSPENNTVSGETNSKWSEAIVCYPDNAQRNKFLYSLFATHHSPLLRRRREFLTLGDRLLDGADHVEGLLGQVIVFALAQPLEAADGIGKLDEDAGRAGEDFGDVERLRQEALDLARARHRQLVLFRQFIHAKDSDNILQCLVALQNLLHPARHLIVLFADDERRQHARRGIQWIDRGVDSLLRDR